MLMKQGINIFQLTYGVCIQNPNLSFADYLHRFEK